MRDGQNNMQEGQNAVIRCKMVKMMCEKCENTVLESQNTVGDEVNIPCKTLYSVMQSDRNSWKIVTFLVAITSERMISF